MPRCIKMDLKWGSTLDDQIIELYKLILKDGGKVTDIEEY